ncbi:hypothetical protein [Pedobacter sp. SYSU D00535]|uniref:hypothetical protein n=1 Tax=Pedobacter sp. SYSU D00535 TaxID=2810308 RepID=UPI001A9671EF|nr:hypothetical protein [Pedobacter sp. SYSU D00535]
MAAKKLSPDQVKLLAESLKEHFIPKDKNDSLFSFHFTAEGTSYRADCKKSNIKGKDVWTVEKVEEVALES